MACFSLNILGFELKVLSTIDLINALLQQDPSLVDWLTPHWQCLVRLFGAGASFHDVYSSVYEDVNSSLTLYNGQLSHILISMQELIPNLVSFSSSAVDQSSWERSSYATTSMPYEITAPSDTVEVNLFSLIRSFVGSISISSLMGSEFMELYPNTLEDVWDLENGLCYLMLDLPRWVPIRSLTKAHIARFRLLRSIEAFHKALNLPLAGNKQESPWRSLDDVSDIIKARASIWKAQKVPLQIIAPCDLSLLLRLAI